MKILIVDDEPDVVKVVRMSFEVQEPTWEAIAAYDGEEALEVFEKEQPELVLLDIMMPEMSGFDVLKELRRFSDVPVIMLTAKGNEIDKVMGLNLGADDYITKPFGHLELLARVKAVLRRGRGTPLTHEDPFTGSGVRVDFETRQVSVDGDRVSAAVPPRAQRGPGTDPRDAAGPSLGPRVHRRDRLHQGVHQPTA